MCFLSVYFLYEKHIIKSINREKSILSLQYFQECAVRTILSKVINSGTVILKTLIDNAEAAVLSAVIWQSH